MLEVGMISGFSEVICTFDRGTGVIVVIVTVVTPLSGETTDAVGDKVVKDVADVVQMAVAVVSISVMVVEQFVIGVIVAQFGLSVVIIVVVLLVCVLLDSCSFKDSSLAMPKVATAAVSSDCALRLSGRLWREQV